MPAPHKAGPEGLNLGRRTQPGVKELTIELGGADIYINLSRKVDLENGHVLYEAVLTDPHGSRAIYIDKDDIVECLRDVFIAGSGPEPEPDSTPPPHRAERGRP